MPLAYTAREFAKKIAFRSRAFNWLSRPRFAYNLWPSQLAFLVNAIDATRHLTGSIVEIGVARGMTTVFLKTHMDIVGDTRRYICIDTFSGFAPGDVEHETSERGKSEVVFGGFAYGDKEVFERNMSGFRNVTVLQKDCKLLTREDVGEVSLALLDVDLYRPTKHAIEVLYDALQPGGVIMVDDVKPGSPYDGSAAAYLEFCKYISKEPELFAGRSGLLRK